MANPQVVVAARKTPRQERSRALVEAILEATVRVLLEDGAERTTTVRVAERAGVSVGSLYQYFPSREALLAAVAQRHTEQLKATLASILDAGSTDLRTALASMIDAVIRAHQLSPALTAALGGELPRFGPLDWKTASAQRGRELAVRLFARHADELKPGLDVEAAALVCTTCVESVMNTAATRSPGRIVDGSIAHELLGLLLGYLT